jgi:hypothetical protein
MALIDIDGVPFFIAWWWLPWRTVNVITRYSTIYSTIVGWHDVGIVLAHVMLALCWYYVGINHPNQHPQTWNLADSNRSISVYNNLTNMLPCLTIVYPMFSPCLTQFGSYAFHLWIDTSVTAGISEALCSGLLCDCSDAKLVRQSASSTNFLLLQWIGRKVILV